MPFHQIIGFSSVINPAGKWDRESSHLLQLEQPFPFSEAKVAWGFTSASRSGGCAVMGTISTLMLRVVFFPCTLHPTAPRKRASVNGNDRPGNRRRKEKTTRGVCDGCNADGLPTLCSHCHVCKVGKQGGQSKAGRDGRRTGIYRQEIP